LPDTDTTSFEVIAHRCRGFSVPEQTPQAIAAALARGVRVHLETRLASDGRWVVIQGAPKGVSESALVARVHARSAAQSRSFALPVEHVLAIVAAHLPPGDEPILYLEVKDLGEERALVASLTRMGLLERTVLLAWEPRILERAHKIAPRLRLGIAYAPLERSLGGSRAATHGVRPRKQVRLTYDPAQRFDALPGIGVTPVHTLSDIASLPLYAVVVHALLCSHRLLDAAHARGARVIAYGLPARLGLGVLARRGVRGALVERSGTLT